MDGLQFDRLTRRLTDPRRLDRRRLAQLLAGLGLFASLGFTSVSESRKRKNRKRKKRCRPHTLSQTCGANGCGSKQNNCKQTVDCGGCTQGTCVGGTCQTLTCSPACQADRPCSGGRCTCSADSQCARDRDPEGFQCLNSVTNPFCGCRKQRPEDLYPRVCVAGEPCSSCCADQECRDRVPDLPDIVCTSLPVNGLVGRGCCVPKDGLCGGNNDCCGGGCVDDVCGCLGTGANCGAHEQCCSNQCGTQATPFKCM
jgi:hypothetical protein